MKLKDNLKNFSKYVARAFNTFVLKSVLKTNEEYDRIKKTLNDEFEKFSNNKKGYIYNPEDKSYLKDDSNGVDKDGIIEDVSRMHEDLNRLEQEVWGLGVNDIVVITPKNKIPEGFSHSIGESNSDIANCYDSIPNRIFASVKKQKSINDDYMNLYSDPEVLNIPHFDQETNTVNRFDQWIKIEDPLTDSDKLIKNKKVVNNSAKQHIRKSDGFSCIHSPGFSETSRSEIRKTVAWVDTIYLNIPHFDTTKKVVKVFVSNSIQHEPLNFEYIYDNKYISLKESYTSNGLKYDEKTKLSYFDLEISIIDETYSSFDENEFIVIKCHLGSKIIENLYVEVYRKGIYLNEFGTFLNSENTISDDLYDTILYKKVNIEEIDESGKSIIHEEEVPVVEETSQGSGKYEVVYDENKKDFLRENFFISGKLDYQIDDDGNHIKDTNGDDVFDYFYDDAIYLRSHTSGEPIDPYKNKINNEGDSISFDLFAQTNTKELELDCLYLSSNGVNVNDTFTYFSYNKEEVSWVDESKEVLKFPVTLNIKENINPSYVGGVFVIYAKIKDSNENYRLMNGYYAIKFVQEAKLTTQNPSIVGDEISFGETTSRFISSSGKINEELKIKTYSSIKYCGHGIDLDLFKSNSTIAKDSVFSTSNIALSDYIPTFILTLNNFNIDFYIFLHRTSLIPNQELKSNIILEKHSNSTSKIEFEKDSKTIDCFIGVRKNKKSNNEGSYDCQFWNPENIASGISLDGGIKKEPSSTSYFPPVLSNSFLVATNGISFKLNKNHISDGDDNVIKIGKENNKFSIGEPTAGPLDQFIIEGHMGLNTDRYYLDLRYAGTTEWEITDDDNSYYKIFSNKASLLLSNSFNKECNNFIILKQFNYKNIPTQKHTSYIGNYQETNSIKNIKYFEYIMNEANNSFKSSVLIEQYKKIHICSKIEVSELSFISNNVNEYGPFHIGKIDPLSSSDYLIEVSPILNSFSIANGMQAEAMGSQFLEAENLSSNVNIEIFIGDSTSNVIGSTSLLSTFNNEDSSSFNLISLSSRSSSSSFGRKKVYYTTKFSGVEYVWRLFEGKRFIDSNNVVIILSNNDIKTYGVLNNDNKLEIPLKIKISHNGPLYVISSLVIKSYEKLY